MPTAFARAGTNVDDVVGVADGVFIVLHHHQRVALVAQALQRTQQDLVVARVQANGGLVEHVAHTLQVAAELRGQADALRLATAERGRAPVQREVAQAHLLQKLKPAFDLGHQVTRNVGFALAHAALGLQRLHPLAQVGDTQASQFGDGHPLNRLPGTDACGRRACQLQAKLHRPSRRIEPGALATWTHRIHQVLHLGLGKGLLATFVIVITHRVVEHLALLLRQANTGADAVRAPAVLAVVGEQARVQLGVTGAAHRAGAQGGKGLQRANLRCRRARQHGGTQATQVAEDMHHAFAMHQRLRQRRTQGGFLLRQHVQTDHRQLDRVLLETVNARESRGRQKVAVHPQVREAARPRPVGQLGVDALAVHHQRRQQSNVLAAEVFHELGGNAVGRLWRHRCTVMNTVLRAQLHKQQAQEMPDLGGGADGRFAPAPG